jgi:DNA polymerase-1
VGIFIEENMKKLLIIDGHNLLFQMFFGMPSRIGGANGQAIQGVVGFIGALNKMIAAHAPTHLVVMFDGETSNPRKDILEEYKANRPDWSEVPDEENPFTQLPYIYTALDYMGVKHAETTVCETDDVIASYAIKYAGECEVIISSFDSDYFQLISDTVRVLRYRGDSSVLCDEAYIKEKYGISPSSYLDFKCLVGDTADNIKGVKGVGPKTAAKLINTFGSLTSLSERADEIEGEKIRTAVKESREVLERNYALIRLSGDAEIPFSLEEAEFKNPWLRTMDVIRGIGI